MFSRVSCSSETTPPTDKKNHILHHSPSTFAFSPRIPLHLSLAVSQWQMRNIHFSSITYSLNFFRSSSLVTLATKFGVFRYNTHIHTKPHSVYSTAYPKAGIFIRSSHFPCFFPLCPRYILLILHRCCRISFWWLGPFSVRLIIVYSPFARSHP